MIEVRQTDIFAAWMRSLKDRRAAQRIAQRLARVQAGFSATSNRLAAV